MAQHMIIPPNSAFIDSRRQSSGGSVADSNSRATGEDIFTANAAGTTTTIVGADANIGTGANVVRIGDKAKVINSDGTVQEETVVTVTGASSATGTTTITFSPALASATASGDKLRRVGPDAYVDNDSLDSRLIELGYTQADCDKMTQNDKVYAVRLADDTNTL